MQLVNSYARSPERRTALVEDIDKRILVEDIDKRILARGYWQEDIGREYG